MAAKKPDNLLDQVLERVLSIVPAPQTVDWRVAPAAVWQQQRFSSGFRAHPGMDPIALDDLLNIDLQKDKLLANTRQFLAGLPANNVLLWGARGTGKSSLVHALLNEFAGQGLRLVEVHKQDLGELTEIVTALSDEPYRFVLFCDDLSFEMEDASYKELKSALEGSVFKTADNVLIYATSNRRHLVPEYMADNQATRVVQGEGGQMELHEGEVVEEKISLSDRFGLWLSFYPFKQAEYLEVVNYWLQKLASAHGIQVDLDDDAVRKEALAWALGRGVRSGRTAQYFARHWIGQLGISK